MMTNKGNTEKKDWQKADARVLGQILAAQNIDFVLPDISHIAGFFAETLNTIPGIASCRVCLEGVTVQRGEMDSGICEECQASRKRAAGQDEISPFLPDFDFKCGLGEQPGMHLNAVASLYHHFGFFTFQVSDIDVFSVYRPFIGNLANYVALSLENRLQRDLLQKSQVELERKVDERTQDLVTINKHIQNEIETRRQTENALKESERQIRQLVDASPVAMIISSGIDEHIETINNKFVELFEYTIEDVPDIAHWWPLAYPDEKYREEIKTQWQTKVGQAIRDKGQIEPIEAMVTCKDGSHRYIEFRLSSIGQKHLITFVDLTERQRAEEALRESEIKFRAVFESSVDAIGVSKVGIHTLVNSAYLALFGYADNAELIGKPILDLIAPSHREQILENVRRRASGQVAPIAYETRGLRKDGSEFDMEVHVSSYELNGEIYTVPIIRDITERKQAQDELRASETRFRAFVNHAADAFFLHDERGNILDVNQQACKSLGYSREELIKMSPLGFDVGADRDRPITDLVESQLDAGETVAFETLHRRKDGSLFPVEVRARPFWQDERRFSVSLARDISERKQAERALQESEERLRQITSSLREVVWLRDAQTRQVLYVNPAFEELTGRTCESFYENRDIVIDTIHPSDKEDVIEALEQRSEGVPFDKEHRIVHLDGSVRWVSSQIFPVRNEAGDVYRWVSIMEDITERKQAEAQLIASEQLFRALVENSPDYIARYNREFHRIYVNPAIQKLFEDPAENVLGMTPTDQTPLSAPQVYIEHLQLAIETAIESTVETPFRTAQGEMHWGQIRFVPEIDPDGKVASVLAIGRDIHEIKENEVRFRMLAENFPDFVVRFDRDGRYAYVNPAFEEAFGMPAEAIIGKTLKELPHFGNPEQNDALLALIQRAFDEDISDESEARWNTVLGERIFEIRLAPEKDATGNVISVLSIARDITERKRAEQEHLAHLSFFESMNQINQALQGSNDLEQRMSDVLDKMLSIFQCDRAWLVYPCDPDSPTWQIFMERTQPEYPSVHPIGVDLPLDAAGAESFRILREAEEPVKFGPGSGHPLPVEMAQGVQVQSFIAMAVYPKVGKPWSFGLHQCSYPREWTLDDERLVQEIGRRLSDALTSLLTYRNLEESQQRYRQLVDISPDAIVIYSQGRIVFVNPTTVKIAGAKSEEDLVGKPILDFLHPEYREVARKALEHLQRTGESTPFVEEKFLRLDGSSLDVEVAIVPYRFQGEDYVQIVARDITERKQHEREREAIITVSKALRQAKTRTEILNVILDQLVDLFNADGTVLVLPDPQTGGFIDEMGRGVVGERMISLNIPPEKGVCNWVIANKKTYINNHVDDDPLFYRSDLLGDSHCVVAAPLATQELIIGALWVARQVDFVEQDLRLLTAIADIAANAVHRVTLHEQTEQQLHRLIALHQIDLAISTSFDLNITLNVILGSVKEELEIDAASILLLNPVTHTLNYAAGIGFRTHNIEGSRVKLGNGCAGHAAQEQRTENKKKTTKNPDSHRT